MPAEDFQLKAFEETTQGSTAPLEKVTENAIKSLVATIVTIDDDRYLR